MCPGICEQRRPRSFCTSAQCDWCLCCPQIETLNNIECFNEEQMPGCNLSNVQDDASKHFVQARRPCLAKRRPCYVKYNKLHLTLTVMFILIPLRLKNGHTNTNQADVSEKRKQFVIYWISNRYVWQTPS